MGTYTAINTHVWHKPLHATFKTNGGKKPDGGKGLAVVGFTLVVQLNSSVKVELKATLFLPPPPHFGLVRGVIPGVIFLPFVANWGNSVP